MKEPRTVYKAGRCWNGAHRDAGKVVHIVMKPPGEYAGDWFEKSLCGTTPGKRSYGWSETENEVNCPKCIKSARNAAPVEINLTINPDDFNSEFGDNHDCAVARSLKRHGFTKPWVGGTTCRPFGRMSPVCYYIPRDLMAAYPFKINADYRAKQKEIIEQGLLLKML